MHPAELDHDGWESKRSLLRKRRAFTWTCALLQETNTQPWGNLQAAVQESLELAAAVDIHELPGLQPLWKKHDLNIQGDANHFVNTLWNLSQTRAFHYRFAEIQEGGFVKDHIQQPILVDFPDDWPENTRLQDLYNGWANTGLGQYLLDDKPVLISHITRNTCVEGTMTKHAKILNPYGTFTVPRSLDGFARASSEFVPAALICHRGPSHNTGHYFAILIYRDLMWIADDGKPPTHLEHLTPQLASQVTQVWAVHIDTFELLSKSFGHSHHLRSQTVIHLYIPAQTRGPGWNNHTTTSTLPMSPTLASRCWIGTGQDKVKSTPLLRPTWTHRNISKHVNTSPFVAGRPLESLLNPTRTTQVLMVASLCWVTKPVDSRHWSPTPAMGAATRNFSGRPLTAPSSLRVYT